MYNHTLEPLLLLSKKFILGETAVFTASSDCATGFTIGIDKNGSRIVTQDLNGNTYSYKPTEPGNYYAYVTAKESHLNYMILSLLITTK